MKSIFFYLLRLYSRYNFGKNCVFGENFVSGPFATCTNPTSFKENIVVGGNCEILGKLLVDSVGKITIGDYTTVRFSSRIFSTNSISIGSFVIISNNVTIYDNNNHPTSPELRMEMSMSGFYSNLWSAARSNSSPIVIEDNVWIGERSYIMKGVRIGRGSIVGLNSVVTKDVPPYSVVVGNPARIVKKLKP